MKKSYPRISIIAGPNGSGKSTCGPDVLRHHFDVAEFVNADTIAKGLSAFHPETVTIEASRIMLKRIKYLAKRNINFAFETTLASRSFASWIAQLKSQGYHLTLIYFWLHSSDLAVERVAERVRLGGHSIPEETIRRRYRSSILNFFVLYQKLADNWYFLDNSDKESPAVIAEGKSCRDIVIHKSKQWQNIKRINNGAK